jgi:NADH dehydrogenase [ubiquinone] 1 alpha subcomplex assembly factor 7
MNELEREIHALIESDGPLSVSRYMALALGHPRHGYYTTRDPLGTAGDFITAPEISQMFGEMLGVWCAAV